MAGASLKRTLEQELKLEPSPEFALEALGGEPAETRVFTSVYHDTGDRSLARLGITLRRRTENGKSVWQLKLPRPSGRLELEARGGPTPPAEIASLLRAPLLGRELTPVAELRTTRSVVILHGPDDALAEVVHDAVEVMEGRRVADRFAEVEVELVAGNGSSLRKLGKRVAKAGAEPSDGTPKVFRALGLTGTAEGLPADAPFAARLGEMLRTQVDAIRLSDPGVRLGDDPEDVHDLRVAVRRLRAILRAARKALPDEWVEPLRGELKWLGSEVMGPLRDLDVLVAHLVEQAEALGSEDIETALTALLPLEAEHARAREAVLEALDGERYLALLTALDNSVDAPPVVADASPEHIAAKEFRKLGKHLDAVDADPPTRSCTRLRIRGKRRATRPSSRSPSPGSRARRFVESAKRLQDVLGDHQDAIVAEERLRSLLRADEGEERRLRAGTARRARAGAARRGPGRARGRQGGRRPARAAGLGLNADGSRRGRGRPPRGADGPGGPARPPAEVRRLVVPEGEGASRARATRTARSARSRRRPACAASSSGELAEHPLPRRARPAEGRPLLGDARPSAGEFRPHEEVDEIRWLPPESAAGQLTCERDLEVLRAFAEGA